MAVVIQVECVKDNEALLHVEDFPDEHDLCGPEYPRLEAFDAGVWQFKVQVPCQRTIAMSCPICVLAKTGLQPSQYIVAPHLARLP